MQILRHLISMHSGWFGSYFPSFFIFPQIMINYLVLSPIFQFCKFKGPKFFVLHYISIHSIWFSSTFLSFLIFPQIKEGGPNFLGGTSSAEWLNYLLPLLYFNFKHLEDPNSSSFNRFQFILHDSEVLLSVFENFAKLKTEDLISSGQPILQNGCIICFHFLYFNFKHLKNPKSSSFIRFQWILHDSKVLLSVFQNLVKLKTEDLIYLGQPILQNGCIICSHLL